MKELLNSDRVNYLVWRFLLESNYRETAAKFQKEWQVERPHRKFDWAKDVNNYALVTTLNKGLVYEDLERQHARNKQAPRDVQAVGNDKKIEEKGVFGKLVAQPDVVEEEDKEDTAVEEPEPMEIDNARKRPVDDETHSVAGGSSLAKRQRLSAGYENGVDTATDPMEIDHAQDDNSNDNNHNNHAYPSPLDADQAASPLPHTEGPEQGVQVDKIHELNLTTTFLRLSNDESTVAPAEASPVRANENPIVLHCEWNPREPAILAAAGTDALARIWTVPQSTPQDADVRGHVDGVQLPFHNLMDDDVPGNSTVSALAWNWDGTAIAIGTAIGTKARIGVWSADGACLHRFDGAEAPVFKLRWSPNNALILGLSPENKRTVVTIYPAASASSVSYVLEHDLDQSPLDATWINETEFVLCGGDLLQSLRYTEDAVVPSRKFETRVDEKFSEVQFDSRSKLLATSSERGTLDVWDEFGQRRSVEAHMDPITCLQWQPLQGDPKDDERLMASGAEDSLICIWNARNLVKVPKYTMNMPGPVLAIAFSPDGAYIAGVSAERILVFKIGDSQRPMASWRRPIHPGWYSPKSNSDQGEEDQHTLRWNTTGRKLAYAANSRKELQSGETVDQADCRIQKTGPKAIPCQLCRLLRLTGKEPPCGRCVQSGKAKECHNPRRSHKDKTISPSKPPSTQLQASSTSAQLLSSRVHPSTSQSKLSSSRPILAASRPQPRLSSSRSEAPNEAQLSRTQEQVPRLRPAESRLERDAGAADLGLQDLQLGERVVAKPSGAQRPQIIRKEGHTRGRAIPKRVDPAQQGNNRRK